MTAPSPSSPATKEVLDTRLPPNETPMMPMPPEEWEKDPGEEVNDTWARGEHIPGVTQ